MPSQKEKLPQRRRPESEDGTPPPKLPKLAPVDAVEELVRCCQRRADSARLVWSFPTAGGDRVRRQAELLIVHGGGLPERLVGQIAFEEELRGTETALLIRSVDASRGYFEQLIPVEGPG